MSWSQFIGKRFAFPVQLDDRNQVALVSDDTAIRQSIYVIIYTVPGERVMRPTFGCRIHELIFDPANEETALVAERYVREALLQWEPRINLRNLSVKPANTEYGELVIRIEYDTKDNPDPRSLVFPFYLNVE